MVKQIVWTKRANAKFNTVIQYLETKWGDAVTENFVKQIYSIINLLADQPALGTIEIPEK
jgi:plasmid stabilization system protein ParE